MHPLGANINLHQHETLNPAGFKSKIVQSVAIILLTSPYWCTSNMFGA
ncbi:hypothetical protein PTET_a1721 [Pseudoalteromonas tetraodonis]|nr:hypothetical protein PSM_A1485 [Pseudoalteromonas sp. SM9913]ATD03132.1 hypothetical protein PTET_a1721 [Pseudoalteromonas tetraodonis]